MVHKPSTLFTSQTVRGCFISTLLRFTQSCYCPSLIRPLCPHNSTRAEGLHLYGDAIVRKTARELLNHYYAYEVRQSWGKLKTLFDVNAGKHKVSGPKLTVSGAPSDPRLVQTTASEPRCASQHRR